MVTSGRGLVQVLVQPSGEQVVQQGVCFVLILRRVLLHLLTGPSQKELVHDCVITAEGWGGNTIVSNALVAFVGSYPLGKPNKEQLVASVITSQKHFVFVW